MMNKLALIDLGSNSARMSVAERAGDGYKELFRRREMVRLSQGMNMDGNLQEDPQKRTISALKKFAQEAEKENARIIAVATAAVRRARNGQEFCARVKEETGIEIQMISGKDEARYDFFGVVSAIPDAKNCLITDVGGGSCELILAKDGEMQGKISLPFGAMTLTDRYFRGTPDEESAKAEILSLYREVGLLESAKGFPLVCLGGSAGSLPYADAKLKGLGELPEIHGYQITKNRLTEILEELKKRTPEERIAQLGLEPGRADTICAGLLPLVLLMEEMDAPHLTVCTAGLREGMLYLISRGEIETKME